MQPLLSKRYFDDVGLKRLEAVLDLTFADLNIKETSEFACASREFVATMLLSLKVDDEDVGTAASKLAIKARSFGVG